MLTEGEEGVGVNQEDALNIYTQLYKIGDQQEPTI